MTKGLRLYFHSFQNKIKTSVVSCLAPFEKESPLKINPSAKFLEYNSTCISG